MERERERGRVGARGLCLNFAPLLRCTQLLRWCPRGRHRCPSRSRISEVSIIHLNGESSKRSIRLCARARRQKIHTGQARANGPMGVCVFMLAYCIVIDWQIDFVYCACIGIVLLITFCIIEMGELVRLVHIVYSRCASKYTYVIYIYVYR